MPNQKKSDFITENKRVSGLYWDRIKTNVIVIDRQGEHFAFKLVTIQKKSV